MMRPFLFSLFTALCVGHAQHASSQPPRELIMDCLSSEFRPDSSYSKPNSIKYSPRKTDSMFLFEELHVVNYEQISRVEFERRLESYKSNEVKSYYLKVMSRGIANHSIFQDYQYRTENVDNIKLTYIRYLFPNAPNYRNRYKVISIAYSAYTPLTWEEDEKWSRSLEHFKKKILRIEEIFNDCSSPGMAE